MEKKKLIILITSIIVLIGLIIGLVFAIKNVKTTSNVISGEQVINNTSEDTVIKVPVDETKYIIKDKYQRYTENDLDIEEVNYNEGNKFKEYEAQREYSYPVQIKYYKISGLKDKELENKINEKIKEYAFSLLPKDNKDYYLRHITLNVTSNFANVLSIGANLYIVENMSPSDPDYNKVEYSDHHRTKWTSDGININLTNGEDITLDDVFISTYNYKAEIQNSIYKNLLVDYLGYEGEGPEVGVSEQNIDETEKASLEARTVAYASQVSKGDYKFYFAPSYVYVFVNNPNDEIRQQISYYFNLEEKYQLVKIFNLYKTEESIFENSGKNKELKYYFVSDEKRIHEYDNLFMYYTDSDEVYPKDYTNEYTQYINGREVANKEFVNKNSNKSLVEFISIEWLIDDVVQSGDWDLSCRVIRLLRVELPREKYNDEMKNNLLDIIKNPWEILGEEDFDYSNDSYLLRAVEKYFKSQNDSNSFEIIRGENKVYFKTHNEFDYNKGHYVERYNVTDTNFYILPSDTRLLTLDDIADMDKSTLSKAYNEIFARYGQEFENKEFKNYFMGKIWYTMIPGKKVSLDELNEIEKTNYEFLKNELEQIS